MAEVHTVINGPKNEVSIVFHNPAQHPLPAGAAQPVTVTGTGSNKAVSGQVANSSVVVRNPA